MNAAPKQLDAFEGKRRRRYGIKAVSAHNEYFLIRCREFAARHAAEHGSVTCDDVRTWCAERGLAPDHSNAWGAVFAKGFKLIDYTKSKLPSTHARAIGRWAVNHGRRE